MNFAPRLDLRQVDSMTELRSTYLGETKSIELSHGNLVDLLKWVRDHKPDIVREVFGENK